jgi:hypothetical protein
MRKSHLFCQKEEGKENADQGLGFNDDVGTRKCGIGAPFTEVAGKIFLGAKIQA